jgi:glycosyltransferase involved in cell wall biosynthesis
MSDEANSPVSRGQNGVRKPGLVMVCDVDFGFPDATRTHSVEVARGFAAEGFDVDLVARGPDPAADGVRFAPARGSDQQRALRLATINSRTIGLLWRRRQTADRFYVRDSWTCMPAVLTARILGYRVVAQVDGVHYGDGYETELPFVVDHVKRLLATANGRMAHGILAVTPQIKQLLIDDVGVPASRIEVVPNGVDLEFFRPLPRAEAIARCGLDQDLRYVVFCGGFYSWSDFDTLLEAFAMVVGERPDTRLILVGDGPERERINLLVQRLGLEQSVILTGLVHERRRVRDYLAAATVTVLVYRADKVSRTSASPIKLTEYLASGRAVAAVEMPGVTELLEETGAGVVVPGNPREFSRAIIDLLESGRADEFGAAGRRFAEERLSWRSVVQRTLPLFGS